MSNEGGNIHAVRIALIHGLEHAHIPLRQQVGADHLDPLPNKTDLNAQHLPLDLLLHDRDIAHTLQPGLLLLKSLVPTLQSPRNQENLIPPVTDTNPITIIQVTNQTQKDPLLVVIEVIVNNPPSPPLDTENDAMAATLKIVIVAIAIHPVVKVVIKNQQPQNKVSRQCKNDMTPRRQRYLLSESSLPHNLLNCRPNIDRQSIDIIEANPHVTTIDTTDLITGKSRRINRIRMEKRRRRRRMEIPVDEVFVTKTISSGLHVKQNVNAINNDGDRFPSTFIVMKLIISNTYYSNSKIPDYKPIEPTKIRRLKLQFHKMMSFPAKM